MERWLAKTQSVSSEFSGREPSSNEIEVVAPSQFPKFNVRERAASQRAGAGAGGGGGGALSLK